METSVSLLERLADRPTDDDWRRLVDLYQPLLRAWMGRAGVADADADDLIQEVLLVVFRDVGGFERRSAGSFRSWLRTILAHRLQNFFRSRRHHPVATGDSAFVERLNQLASPDSELSREWDRQHDRHVAGKIMQRVEGDVEPPTWRAFRRQVIDGVSAAEVAAELGLSRNAVLLAKSRVLKRLRAELAGLVDCSS
jgi:RNA polymerase sigma-70 factor (ECF subfamily)